MKTENKIMKNYQTDVKKNQIKSLEMRSIIIEIRDLINE